MDINTNKYRAKWQGKNIQEYIGRKNVQVQIVFNVNFQSSIRDFYLHTFTGALLLLLPKHVLDNDNNTKVWWNWATLWPVESAVSNSITTNLWLVPSGHTRPAWPLLHSFPSAPTSRLLNHFFVNIGIEMQIHVAFESDLSASSSLCVPSRTL